MNVQVLPDEWAARLADAIGVAVLDLVPQLAGDNVALLAVDCHPWNGFIALALLTESEVASDPLLAAPGEMAAWRYYNFTADMPSWQLTSVLGQQMRAAYESGDHKQVVEAYLRACAAAAKSPQVVAAIGQLSQAVGFRVSVCNPDDGREFVAS